MAQGWWIFWDKTTFRELGVVEMWLYLFCEFRVLASSFCVFVKTSYMKHLMTGIKGNTVFCFPKMQGNIECYTSQL